MRFLVFGLPPEIEAKTLISLADARTLLQGEFTSCIVDPEHLRRACELLEMPIPVGKRAQIRLTEGDSFLFLCEAPSGSYVALTTVKPKSSK